MTRTFIFPGVAPTVRIDEQRVTIAEGQSGSLRCEVTGSPQPTITWSKVGGELDDNFRVYENTFNLFICVMGNINAKLSNITKSKINENILNST